MKISIYIKNGAKMATDFRDEELDWREIPFETDRFVFQIAVGVMIVIAAVIVGLALFPNDKGFQGNLYTTIIGVLITIFVLDRQAERRETKRVREQLIRELKSGVDDISKRAAEELYDQGWVTDGSLEGRVLYVANAENVEWRQARLKNTQFDRANFQDTDLSFADLRNTYLVCENLKNVSLHQANLEGAELSSTNLENAILSRANLRHAELRKADFTGATLRRANLEGACLKHTNFREAMLDETNMRNTYLFGAKLFETYLTDADLTGAEMCYADIDTAKFRESTILPDGNRWAKDTDMERFTNPSHPQFWRSDDPNSAAWRGYPKIDRL